MITFRKVTKVYRLDAETSIQPVRDLNLEMAPGEFIIVIGRSGTGKTTLLNLAAGLIKPTSGEVLFGGKDLASLSDAGLAALRNQKIGFVFQFPSLLPSLTVRENVALPRILCSGKRAEALEAAAMLLEKMGLRERMEVFPKQLSSGEQKRTVIARSLINQPQLVLADEPTSDLDEQTEREVMELLSQINQSGVAIIMVTHSLDLTPHAHRVFKMDKGSLVPVPGKGSRAPVDVSVLASRD